MEIYTRVNPDFSLCGLNCGLCPNFHIHTNRKFKCPGCGGENFLKSILLVPLLLVAKNTRI
jgi:hypothetical protein